ncbi:MAG TPA: hypothetical protein VG268_17330 [Streptosporangiaceae bacterium]|nr:hypothetical protein [Streptosporangiaceae bacterium]
MRGSGGGYCLDQFPGGGYRDEMHLAAARAGRAAGRPGGGIADQDADTGGGAAGSRHADVGRQAEPPQPAGQPVLIQADQHRRGAVRQLPGAPRIQTALVGGRGRGHPASEFGAPRWRHQRQRMPAPGRELVLQGGRSHACHPLVPQDHQIGLRRPGGAVQVEQCLFPAGPPAGTSL